MQGRTEFVQGLIEKGREFAERRQPTVQFTQLKNGEA